jgi:hypothetical protein
MREVVSAEKRQRRILGGDFAEPKENDSDAQAMQISSSVCPKPPAHKRTF